MDIAHQFQSTSAELVGVQNELSRLFGLSQDPLIEAQSAVRRAELTTRRDALLAHWGRLGLAWLLQGGGVQLLDPGMTASTDAIRSQRSDGSSGGSEQTPPSAEGGGEQAGEHGAAPVTATAINPDRVVDLTGLERNFGPSWVRSATPIRQVPLDVEKLKEVLRSFDAPPQSLDDELSVREELRRLAENTPPSALNLWGDFPKDVQRALVGMSVARARHIQDEVPPNLQPITIEQELDRFFSGMTAFSKREQPGFVFGLRRHHHPVADRWAEDAQRWWQELSLRLPEPVIPNPERALDDLRTALDEGVGDEELIQVALNALDANVSPEDPRFVRMMLPHQDKLRKHTRFKRLRKAIRDMMTDDEALEAEAQSDTSGLPEDWPYLTMVQGKRASIVGGDLREDARKKIQTVFGFSEVEWVTTDHSRNIQNLANSIRGGAVDFVIILRRFIGHNVDRMILPAAKAVGVPWISVERGYGTQQVRIAIERFLTSGPDSAEAE